ncbi:MAG: metallophosphoesterase family protein [Bacteroidota bacterium]|nr:metallophosphoesterase family protein [Bacteroidota bacterium]MDP4289901.1 metallophosphoesterase family protein [Bacteroidota bacterium]
MTRIGILSDTHGYIHPRIFEFFSEVDEIWHAGDIGNLKTAFELAAFKPLKAVYGNIDNAETRLTYPLTQSFTTEAVKVIMTHIAGTAHSYSELVKEMISVHQPGILVCGHSHILKVKYQPKEKLLHINPGAAGVSGFHHVITVIRLEIDGSKIQNMEVLELERKMV